MGEGKRWGLMAAMTGTVALAVLSGGQSRIMAQDPPAAAKPTEEGPKPPGQPESIPHRPNSLDPVPDPAIPDDPPPHEGSMVQFPYRVHAPDILIVEVLEALPGRPITGERLIRPDGTISLGFYGDLNVEGLTTTQVKEKVILHLRRYLNDEMLGLWALDGGAAPADPPIIPAPEGNAEAPPPPDDHPVPPLAPDGEASPFDPPAPPHHSDTPKTSALERTPRTRLVRQTSKTQEGRGTPKVSALKLADTPANDPQKPEAVEDAFQQALERMPMMAPEKNGQLIVIPARDSDRVFVDIASYNSHVYFVLGEVSVGGRFPWTGRETVLDALQYAGGLDPNADPKDIRLVRPTRGGKPAKVYPIDLEAIRDRGDATANLQIFAGDRLVVGRSPTVETTIRVNAEAARLMTMLNGSLTYAHLLGKLDELAKANPERRAALLKAWADYRKTMLPAATPEEEKFFDEVRKLLDQ